MTITANLVWDAAQNADAYTVLRTTDGGPEETVFTSPTELSFSDATLTVGHVYAYTVETSNQFGATLSNEVTGDTRPPTAAVLVVSLAVTP